MRSFPQSVSNSARTGLCWAGITLAVALLAGEAGAQAPAPAPMAARQAAALTGAKVGTSQADTHEYRLANGLRLIVKEDHRAPTVAHMVWYHAGSIDEHNGTTGVAHMLEHMMFKGTRAVGPGEFSRRVAALGGRENAMTTRDFTMYFQQIEKSHLADVMALEADRMANLQLTDKEFKPEMNVVKEERRMRIDDSARATVYEQMLAVLFNAAPYRNPTIGWPSDLDTMTVQDAQDWYHKWYAPNNATVVVTGDVNPDEVFRQAQRTYGKLQPHALPRRYAQDEPKQVGVKRIWVKAPAENPYVVLAYKAPPLRDVEKDVDPYALEVLSAVLDGYDNARLPNLLVKGKDEKGGRLADDVNAGYDGMNRGPSIFLLDGVPADGHTTAEIEQALRAQIDRIARDGVTEAELKRVKAQVVAAQIYKRDSVFGQGMEIGMAEMTGLSWRDLDRILEKIKSVTPAQVQQVAKTYFTEDNLVVATLLPQPIDPNKPVRKPVPGMREEGGLR
ncbi:insulinase family protein [Ralstonia pseudosolanacearum]|uniref:M16 family metallopeptidase n=1 Tax=Ralstonia solanacearum species complex TaxID=3116862 RepID=UPI002002E392|nr:pitrilysin family protein [Ralstonia pseudosolanacearum]MCK4122639.1 insulinase family protein [Ralstonia pseudosolanacearum]